MTIYKQGNIIAEMKIRKVNVSGLNFFDEDGEETHISLFNSMYHDSLFLGFTKNSSIEHNDFFLIRDALSKNDNNSIRNMLKISRQISLELRKNLFVHSDIAEEFNIMNFISVNDLMIPMSQEEIMSFNNTTGSSVTVDVDKFYQKLNPSSYINKKVVHHKFKGVFIPDKAGIKFIHNPDVDKEDFSLGLFSKSNDFSKVKIDLKGMNKVSIRITKDDTISPPEILHEQSPSKPFYLEIYNKDSSYRIPEKKLFYGLVDKNVNFKYKLGTSFKGKAKIFDDYVRDELHRYIDKKHFFKKLANAVEVIDYMNSNNLKMEEVFDKLEDHYDLNFIKNHRDDTVKYLEEKGIQVDHPNLSM